jgi:hypothetical protein
MVLCGLSAYPHPEMITDEFEIEKRQRGLCGMRDGTEESEFRAREMNAALKVMLKQRTRTGQRWR